MEVRRVKLRVIGVFLAILATVSSGTAWAQDEGLGSVPYEMIKEQHILPDLEIKAVSEKGKMRMMEKGMMEKKGNMGKDVKKKKCSMDSQEKSSKGQDHSSHSAGHTLSKDMMEKMREFNLVKAEISVEMNQRNVNMDHVRALVAKSLDLKKEMVLMEFDSKVLKMKTSISGEQSVHNAHKSHELNILHENHNSIDKNKVETKHNHQN